MFKKAALMVLALLVCLFMLRLGVWQLSRADEKQVLLDQVLLRSSQAALNLNAAREGDSPSEFKRYTPVNVSGKYIPNSTIFVENQVLDGKVGYLVFSVLDVAEYAESIVVNRGWIPAVAGQRPRLELAPTEGSKLIHGRLNTAPAKPPFWQDQYPVFSGKVWQFLPIDKLSVELQRPLMPLVLELAPASNPSNDYDLKRKWRSVDAKAVGKHKAYAFQWFSMALAFLIACVVLLIKSLRSKQLDVQGKV